MSDYMKEMERLIDEVARLKWSEAIYDASGSYIQARNDREAADEARAALLAHAAQRVPDLLDRISAAHDASLDDEHETCRGLLRECLASLILTSTAPSAPAAPVEPSEVPIPRPDKVAYSSCGISFHSESVIRQYGDAREAAGYARGVAEERERCAAICDRMGNPLNVKYEGGGCRKAAAAIRAEQQAVIDRLMLEHCPDEMTAEQRQTWAAAQAEKGGE